MNGIPEHDGPALPADRRQLLRDHLMNEIGTENVEAPVRPRRRRLGWVALPALAGALSLAVVLTPGEEPAGRGSPTVAGPTAPTAGPASSAPSGTAPVTPSAAVQLLDRIAAVAASGPVRKVENNQFVYVMSVVKYPDQTPDGPVPGALHERQVWLSVDGSRPGRLLDRTLVDAADVKAGRPGGPAPDGTLPLDTNPSPNLHSPTYRYLAGLPTDPDEMFALLNSEPHGERWTDQRPFGTIGDLLGEQIAPPAVAAALYRAAAKIPGVEVIRDSVDAAGRHGVAVGLSSQDVRVEWIFDRNTGEFLGERRVVLRDGLQGKAGDVIAETAVLARAIVDAPGDRP
ncbi:CU044_5270 family protein [Streptomyces sp. NRRL B-24484]|uniref:CU044_5270 family protein n=1 Tax=Streptomyces sp. NRRL B-24484 TaxID=1463833 RepID=UPI000693D14F|nr:CU044_5270 family protein [Streptomyces sp. NRRL B-24484]